MPTRYTGPLTTGIVDVHGPDGACDYAAFVAGGGVAYIQKATEGGDFVDKAYARVMPALKEHGLLAGAYHFSNAGEPIRQADHFLRTTAAFPEALKILDWETAPKGSRLGTMTADNAAVFVSKVQASTGRWPVLYTYDYVLRKWMGAASPETRAVLAKCGLWLAKYGEEPAPFPASWAAWPRWSLWQYSSSVTNGPADRVRYPRGVPGFKRKSQDRSCFEGTVDELRVWWKTTGLPGA